MLRDNGSELVLDLRNGARRTGELNAAAAGGGGERALVPSSTSMSCRMALSLAFVQRTYSLPIVKSVQILTHSPGFSTVLDVNLRVRRILVIQGDTSFPTAVGANR